MAQVELSDAEKVFLDLTLRHKIVTDLIYAAESETDVGSAETIQSELEERWQQVRPAINVEALQKKLEVF